MNTSGWRWVGSVPSMQGEISHWWPLTDGGLTARCNTDPREYQVSPHYTLHRLFQLPMLPPLIGRHAQNNVETLLLKNIKSSLFNLTFLPCITVCLGMLSLIFFSSVFFDNFLKLSFVYSKPGKKTEPSSLPPFPGPMKNSSALFSQGCIAYTISLKGSLFLLLNWLPFLLKTVGGIV